MSASASIFFDFNLPNSTTWFYCSFLLAMALFFKFSRFLTMRNWDVVTLFLLVPGMLMIQQAHLPPAQSEQTTHRIASLVAGQAGHFSAALPAGVSEIALWKHQSAEVDAGQARLLWFGYLWLLCGSACFLVRCLVDLVLESRPAISPNLSFGGLAWLAGTLFVCLIAVAYRPERKERAEPLTPLEDVKSGKIDGVQQKTAELGPQSAAFDLLGFWLKRTFALACHLTVVAGLIVMGAWHYRDAAAGMAAATFYLMLPYTGLHVGQAQHVWPMAMIVWAVVLYRSPTVAGILLGLATVPVFFPILIVPVWIGFYWRRGAARFIASFLVSAAIGFGIIGAILWHNGDLAMSVRGALSLSAWQPWKIPTTEGIWAGVHWAYRIPIFIGYAAFVITTAFWPCPKNLAHTVALSAAVIIGLQFWYADQGGVYVLWYLPLFLLMVFRPRLSERRPPLIKSEKDWLLRLGRGLGGLLGKVLGSPRQPVGSAFALLRRLRRGVI